MHGTFRGRMVEDAGVTVRFDMAASPVPVSRSSRAKLAALLAGCCAAVLPIASPTTPSRYVDRPPPGPHTGATTPVLIAASYPIRRVIAQVPSEPTQAAAALKATAPRAIPRFVLAPLPAPPVIVDLPDPATELAAVEPVHATFPPDAPIAPLPLLRPVDVMQIADSEVRSLRVPQLNEPGLAASGVPTLAGKVAAMQVTPLPPARLRHSERAILLAEAPTSMTIRIGDLALGKVDFHMTDARTIDVQLSGLLDLLASHYDSGEFARLRTSAAADAYVSFDQLRALGLTVRYDAVYDELRING